MTALIPILLLVMALYFVILPQRRRAQAQRSLATTLAPGDRIVTAGGIIGTLQAVEGERAWVEVADGVVMEVLTPAIVRRVEPDVPASFPDAADNAGHPDDPGPDAHPEES